MISFQMEFIVVWKFILLQQWDFDEMKPNFSIGIQIRGSKKVDLLQSCLLVSLTTSSRATFIFKSIRGDKSKRKSAALAIFYRFCFKMDNSLADFVDLEWAEKVIFSWNQCQSQERKKKKRRRWMFGYYLTLLQSALLNMLKLESSL